MAHQLDFLFRPRSVAVIGASKDPEKWGYLMSKSLIESKYGGRIYLVNVKGGEVCGRQTFRDLSEIGDPVDLVVIGIPAKFVPDAIRGCVKKGVKGVIIASAHFGEHSEEGKTVEKELLDIARAGGMRVVGPNCLGIFNSAVDLNTTLTSFPRGPFAFLTQSGNFGLEVNYFAKKRNLGFSKFISFGNQIDILCHEYLDYVKDDPDSKAVLIYMEGFRHGNGNDFVRVARKTVRTKPIIAIKAGKTLAGSRAAASHTGSLAGSDVIYNAALRQAGVIRVENSDELLDVGEALFKCPKIRGNRIAILANGGGTATMAADAAERQKLKVPVLSEKCQSAINGAIVAGALHSSKNPVDFADEADIYAWERFAKILLEDEAVDGLVIVGGYGGYTDVWPAWKESWEKMAHTISRLPRECGKPIVVHSMFRGEMPESLRIFTREEIPIYPTVERAMRCMGALADYCGNLGSMKEEEEEKGKPIPDEKDEKKARSILMEVRASGRVNFMEPEAREFLGAYNVPVSPFAVGTSGEEAVSLAKQIGYPVAIKVVSPDILHKSDAGGVRLNLRNDLETSAAFSEVIGNAKKYDNKAKIYGVLISPMESSVVEVIIGITKDEVFGPVIMFGIGGLFVEVLSDVSFRVAPIERSEALEMIHEIKGFPVLAGARGRKCADLDAIADILHKISKLAIENPEIKEMDLNPVFVRENGALVGDARIVLEQQLSRK